jgi:hypothetical protein
MSPFRQLETKQQRQVILHNKLSTTMKRGLGAKIGQKIKQLSMRAVGSPPPALEDDAHRIAAMRKRVQNISTELDKPKEETERVYRDQGGTQTIVALLENSEIHNLLVEFAKKDYSVENILLYDAIQQYKTMSDTTNGRRVKALDIVKRFLLDDSEHLVNISADVRRKVILIVEKMEGMLFVIQPLRDDLFYEVETGVIANLADVLSRFSQTPVAPSMLKDWDALNNHNDDY